MSHLDYTTGLWVSINAPERLWTAVGLVQAAMRVADPQTLARLVDAMPEVYADMQARKDAPYGLLEHERGIGEPDPALAYLGREPEESAPTYGTGRFMDVPALPTCIQCGEPATHLHNPLRAGEPS